MLSPETATVRPTFVTEPEAEPAWPALPRPPGAAATSGSVYGDIAMLAARLFAAPMSLVAIAAPPRLQVVGVCGLAADEAGHAGALVEAAIRDATVVWDAGVDDHPVLPWGVRFHVTAPILSPDGRALGAVCVMDRAARLGVSEPQAGALQALARLAGAELERQRQAADVTAHVQTEAQLREREASFRYLFDQNPNPMVVCAVRSFRVLAANEAALRLYGYTREAFVGLSVDNIRVPPPDTAARPPLPAHGPGVSFVRVATHRRRSGVTFPADIRASAIVFGGRPAWLTVVRDITDQQRAQAQLAEAEAKLRQSQKLEAIGHLTGGIAHDFNNLLTVILGNVELLQESQPPDSAGAELLAVVARAAERGADLTSQLLSFARRQALAPHQVDVNALLHKMHALLARSIGEHIVTAFAPSDDLWPALIDPAQLETAVLNLVVNARDAMPDGGTITVSTRNVSIDSAAGQPDAAPGDYVLVTVADTGAGMTADVLGRAFDPFFTTKEPGKGSGLGLSMVYGFARQSGGHVRIESVPGAGTRVLLHLPRAAHEKPEAPDPGEHGTRGPGGHESILIVEDDARVRAIVEAHLRGLGYHVLVAGNGIEALDILMGPARIDLMLSDMVMPGGLTGLQLSEQALRIRPGLRVLFASGYSQDALEPPHGQDDGKRLLRKPYRRGELAARIRELLDAPG
ncbi:ATP-binding protein [Vineibacter terrae]|uniref:ATP-binding protein n=1 Tax=Vineibacter terrae TaxID=2586908 RepID=UPI002E306272|nr:ATP-binding protein [Vineibacter terrae]HEX2889041.1 ATP-binding protein [Vineibacter terrae]